jgi:hypothetical protein
VFAGAAREAVFSRPEVIRQINAHFVPVALKAALVNNPPDDEEGRLYREIARSRIAPQGICVVNSAGKVLDWVLMFDDDRSVLAFLDHARKRFARFPDARQPVSAERYMKFPSSRLADVKDNGKAPLVIERHTKGKSCPAKPLLQRGTVVVRVFGRALGKDGKAVADTVRQEHYVEDRFHVSLATQEALARALAKAGSKPFRIGDDLAQLLVSHAYLGQLDVNPVGAPGGKGRLDQCEFWAQMVGTTGLRIEGQSAAAGASRGGGGDGRFWEHEVKLVWEGLIEVKGDRITRLLLLARGAEKLRWGNKRAAVFKGSVDVARLPGGHAIDLACAVRYGLIGEPVAAAEATDAPAQGGADPIVLVPDEARRQLIQAFGSTFLVFRARVQKELELSAAQKQKLEQRLIATIQDARRFFQTVDGLKSDEREKKVSPYRQKVQEKLVAFLEETLKARQLARLRQLELQHNGLLALGQPAVAKELKLTDKQHKRFMAVVQELQQQLQALIQKAQSEGRPEEIAPKAMKIRKVHEGKIKAILSTAQKKQWQEMLGKPFILDE